MAISGGPSTGHSVSSAAPEVRNSGCETPKRARDEDGLAIARTVPYHPHVRTIGLTGGIGSGKSTVARMLAQRGARVLDADVIARDIVRPGQPAYDELVALFGSDLVLPSGELDRRRLGERAFADPALRTQLNAITHPRIAAATAERLAALRENGTALAVYEASLLVENGSYRAFDGLLVVTCPVELQVARVLARASQDVGALDENQVRARIAAQASPEARRAAATWLLDSSGSLAEVERQVDALWPLLLNQPKV